MTPLNDNYHFLIHTNNISIILLKISWIMKECENEFFKAIFATIY